MPNYVTFDPTINANLNKYMPDYNYNNPPINPNESNIDPDVFKTIGTKDYGYVQKAYFGNLTSDDTIAVIIGMHPIDGEIHNEILKSIVKNDKNLNKKIVLYKITVTENPYDYFKGRMNGQLLGQNIIVPDIASENPMFVLDCHENNGADSNYEHYKFLYPISKYPVTTQSVEQLTNTYMSQIINQAPFLKIYSPPNPTSPEYVTIPISEKGIPTVIYETYRFDKIINKTQDAEVIVKSLNYINNPNKVKQTLTTYDLNQFQGEGKYFTALVKNASGNLVENEDIDFKLIAKTWNKTYTQKTDINGIAKLQINLFPGIYQIKTTIKNNPIVSKTNTVTVLEKIENLSTKKLITSDFEEVFGEGKYFKAVLEDSNGMAIANDEVSFKILAKTWNKTYTLKTNNNGIAQLQINLFPGIYKIETINANSKTRINTITVIKKI